MTRRDFILLLGGAVVTSPIAARGQQSSKIYRLGYLAQARIPHLIEALQTGLREFGYVEGKNLKIEYRIGGNQLETLDVLAAELAQLGPDAIVTVGTPAAIAAKRSITTIPIVMAPVGDPVRYDIVASLALPGGNITGVTLYTPELSGKRVEVLKETVPGIARLAVLGNAMNPATQYLWEGAQLTARALQIEPKLFMVREMDEFAAAFAAMLRSGVDAVFVQPDITLINARQIIIALAVEHRLPAMYSLREFVEDGGLISYGPNIAEMTRRSPDFVDKVLKGSKPADLAIDRSTKFELIINLKTARALSLTMPPSLLARADEVIE
jgi:putative ABC transport system substrate-binding protein